MFKFFNKNTIKTKKVLEETNINTANVQTKDELLNFFDSVNSINNTELFLNNFFKCEEFYTYVFSSKSKEDKYYTQIVNSQLLGFIYTDKSKAENHLNDELKSFKKDGLGIKHMNLDSILEYINNLRSNSIDGLIINYPYNWVVFNIKK